MYPFITIYFDSFQSPNVIMTTTPLNIIPLISFPSPVGLEVIMCGIETSFMNDIYLVIYRMWRLRNSRVVHLIWLISLYTQTVHPPVQMVFHNSDPSIPQCVYFNNVTDSTMKYYYNDVFHPGVLFNFFYNSIFKLNGRLLHQPPMHQCEM